MKQARIRNLLKNVDSRLLRAERALSSLKSSDAPPEVLRLIHDLRASIMRHYAKLERITIEEVETFETQLRLLRDISLYHLSTADKKSPSREVLESLVRDELGLMNLTSGMRIGLNQLTPDDVIEMVPGQKPAAFQFRFKQNVLTVADQPISLVEREQDISSAALELAIEHGEYVESELAATNLSPRLKGAFTALQKTLASHKNIVQVGMRTQLCNRIVQAEIEEISPTLFALMVGHLQSVASTLAQFEDWRVFSENAVSTNADRTAIIDLTESVRSLAAHLEKTNSADPSVAQALETVSSWVEVEGEVDKRDFLGLARTVENIWSVITKSVFAVAKETLSEGKKMAARGILLVLIGSATAGMMHAMGGVPGAQWLESVYLYFKANPVPPGTLDPK